MVSQTDMAGGGSEVFNPLPPVLCNNPRLKIDPEKVSLSHIFKGKTKRYRKSHTVIEENPKEPVPLYPLQISWFPNHFCFDLYDEIVICNLRIWNPGDRKIYVKCCGLWDESARLGASWCCYPYTRLRLVPGFSDMIHIKATPRDHSPIPYAHIALQIAAAHLRDNIVGYFCVPIFVKFMTYVAPCITGEDVQE